jgi:sugar phosphate isomerase/epimerase
MYRALQPGAVGIAGGSLETRLRLTADSGFEGLYVGIGEVMDLGAGKVRDMFDKFGLKPAAWGFPVEFRGDKETYERDLKELPSKAAAAKELGCFRTSTWISPASNTLTFEENFKFHVEKFRPAAEILNDYGCRLGLEFVAPKTLRQGQKYEFIYDLNGMLELCSEIGTGNIGLLLDAWHWYTSHGTVEDLKQLTDDDIVDVHINDAPEGVPVDEQMDNVRRLPGETGVIDIATFLRSLNEMGYTGPIMAEPFRKDLGELPAEEAAKTVSESMDKVWKLAGLV